MLWCDNVFNRNQLTSRIWKRLIAFLGFIFLILPVIFFLICDASAEDPVLTRLQDDINYLCSPELAGRDVPGPTGDMTALWLARKFNEIGLLPGVGDSSYLQEVQLQAARLDTEKTNLIIYFPDRTYRFGWSDDFYIFPKRIADFDLTLNIVNAHYGIASKQLNRNDFNVGVEGKAAVVLAGSGSLRPDKVGRHALTPFKAAAAERADASALITLVPTDAKKWPPKEIESKIIETRKLKPDLPDANYGFPVIYLNGSILIDTLNSQTMEQLLFTYFIDPELLKGVEIKLSVSFRDKIMAHGYNVCGKIEGSKSDYILVGAHYDHLGSAGEDSIGKLKYYHGADDNASGVAGLLEVSRRWMVRKASERGLLVIGFTAEEDGLLGSQYFVQHPPVTLSAFRAMVNLDMIGRSGYASMREAKLSTATPDPNYAAAYYAAASPRLRDIIHDAGVKTSLNLEIISAGRFPFCDAGPFHNAHIPTIHIFSGFHKDYSQLNDTPDRLNWEKLSQMVLLTDVLLVNLNKDPHEIEFDASIRTSDAGMKY